MNAAANQVHVDPAAELAAIAAIGADAAADDAAAAAEAELEQHNPEAWRKASDFVVAAFSTVCVPNWELSVDDCNNLSLTLAGTLDHYFPGGPTGPTSPAWALAFALATVVATRGVDWERGRLKPTHKPKPKETATDGNDETQGRDAHVPDGSDAQRQDHHGFTFGGG